MVLHGIALHLMILHSLACHCIVSYDVAWYCIVGFGAGCIPQDTYLLYYLIKTEPSFLLDSSVWWWYIYQSQHHRRPRGPILFFKQMNSNHTQLLSSVYCTEIYLYSNHKKSIKLWEKSEFRCVIVIPIDISPSAIAIALFDTLTLKAALSVYCVEIYLY